LKHGDLGDVRSRGRVSRLGGVCSLGVPTSRREQKKERSKKDPDEEKSAWGNTIHKDCPHPYTCGLKSEEERWKKSTGQQKAQKS